MNLLDGGKCSGSKGRSRKATVTYGANGCVSWIETLHIRALFSRSSSRRRAGGLDRFRIGYLALRWISSVIQGEQFAGEPALAGKPEGMYSSGFRGEQSRIDKVGGTQYTRNQNKRMVL